MAQNITLMGASYSAVPAVVLPKTGGGTASFTDVTDTTAAAGDVASGKYFYTASGIRTQGTSSGGGGGGIGTLLATTSLGSINATNTTAQDTGKTVSVTDVTDYDLLIVETSRDSVSTNRHMATVRCIYLINQTDITTKNAVGVMTYTWNCKLSSTGVYSSRQGTTAYGIYANSCTLTTSSGVTSAVIALYQRYNSTSTGTINGDYTTRVYGVKLFDLIGG